MSKITAEDLQRNACVYIRKSTPDQLMHNPENQRRQCRLADRAKQPSKSSTTISDDRGGGIARQASSDCWPQFCSACFPTFHLGLAPSATRCERGSQAMQIRVCNANFKTWRLRTSRQ